MDKNAEIKEWIKKADQDLDVVDYLQNMIPKPLEVICFHCQQSSEKYFKAYLVQNNIPVKKTHDLIFLNFECEKIDKSFSELKEKAAELTEYAVDIRYPYSLDIDNVMTNIAVKSAKEIKRFVIEKLNIY